MTLPLGNLYDDIARMGFNAVTQHLDYALLESDDSPCAYHREGVECVERHVDEAAAHGLYVIINMDSAQSSDTSDGPGSFLWCRPGEQNRLIVMWSAIAAYYAGRPCVLGHSLFGESLPRRPAWKMPMRHGAIWLSASLPGSVPWMSGT